MKRIVTIVALTLSCLILTATLTACATFEEIIGSALFLGLTFTDSACAGKQPDANDMEAAFSEHKEDFQSVADYLTDTYPVTTDLDAVYITGSDTIIAYRTQTESVYLDRKDTPVADTPIAENWQRLKQAGCQSVSMDPQIDGKGMENAIYFCMWTRTVDEADAGIAYAIDSSYPPQIEFQTVLEPLSEDGWYYTLAEYEEWRNTKPTFISTNDEG